MKTKTALITGATGLLGTHLLLAKPNHWRSVGTVHTYNTVLKTPETEYVTLDVTNEEAVHAVVEKIQPNVIFHTAAHGRLDYCENHKDEAYSTNFLSTKYFVDAVSKFGGKLVFCSTNATFDGMNPPYDETSKQVASSYYAETKILSEQYIRQSPIDFTIVRLMTMYGWNWQPERLNMVSMLIEKLRNKQELWMTNDVFNNMLFVGQAARFFWDIAQHPRLTKRETFNIAGAQIANRFETTLEACEVFELDRGLVHEVDSSYFDGKEVTRSPDTSFVTKKAQEVLGFKPWTLKRGLKFMLDNPLPRKRSYLFR